ncbi:MAG: diguanylate cyclase, partial [Pseudohongiellaceae bacterium]
GRIKKGLADHDGLPGDLTTLRTIRNKQLRIHVGAFRSNETIVLELEQEKTPTPTRWSSRANSKMEELLGSHSQAMVTQKLVEGIRLISGYDRALLYVFDQDFNGCVLAEDCNDKLPSMQGQHFPASDIPPQVRSLYFRKSIRIIADARAKPVPLVPVHNPATGAPVDLGSGILRAASPVHCEYLSNMGVRSAVSIAIFSKDQLWGIVACHNGRAKILTPAMRDSCASLTKLASQRLFLLKAEAEADYHLQVQANRVRLSRELQQGEEPLEALHNHAGSWMTLFSAQGLALVYRRQINCAGTTPSTEEIHELLSWLETQIQDMGPWSTESLLISGFSGANAIKDYCCGLLAMPLMISKSTHGWLLLFRPEVIKTIEWAGRPDKSLTTGPSGAILTPRHSFAAWIQKIRDKSKPWLESELKAARDLGDDLAILISAFEISRLNEDLRKERQALAKANKDLRELAYTDSLTGIMNRYRIEHMVQLMLANARRYHHTFSILLFDIDRFKKVNDTHGHEEGDRILKQLVQVLEMCLREGDQPGRWGGEEFVVLAPGTTLKGAIAFAERLRSEVAASDFGLGSAITISIGVAQWQPEDTLKTLVNRADKAMYEAKSSGRNRVRPTINADC